MKTSGSFQVSAQNIDCGYLLEPPRLRTSSKKKVGRKVEGVPRSQTAALPRHQEEEETDKLPCARVCVCVYVCVCECVCVCWCVKAGWRIQ